jgi:transcriptional regulator with XRE-family HTH domain
VATVKELPDRWHELGEFIREQRGTSRLSLRKLSELAGISNPYLSQIERGLRKPSAEILQQIAKALRISAETLYVRAGILEEHHGEDLVGEILRDQSLTEDQKQTIIKIYQAFRRENEGRVMGPPAGEATASPRAIVAALPSPAPSSRPPTGPTGPTTPPSGPNDPATPSA